MGRNLRSWAGVATIALVVGMVGVAPAGGAARDVSQFACPPDLTSPFTDIAGTTHELAIECAVHYELTGGTTPTTYTPGGIVTRGQMATFLVRLIGIAPVLPGDFPPTGFDDVEGSPHQGSIEALVAFDIADGTSATTFSPNDPVSRAQMATFLLRTIEDGGLDRPDTAGANTYTDDDGTPHQGAIDAITEWGIATGTGPTTYSPEQPVSRGAMASFLVRVVDLLIAEGIFVPVVTSRSVAALTGDGGRGTAMVVTTDVPGVLCVAVELAGVDASAPAAIHELGGPAVVELPRVSPDELNARCLVDPDADRINVDPGAFEVVVDAPGGALSGQLGEIATEFGAELGHVEVFPGPGDETAGGIVFGLTTSAPGVACFTVLALSESPVTAVHLHRGDPHANGAVVSDLRAITFDDLFGDPELETEPVLGLDCVDIDEAADLADDPGDFYVDVHTEDFPDGALRGQLEESLFITFPFVRR